MGKLSVDMFTSLNIPLSNCIAFGSKNAIIMLAKKNGVVAVPAEAHENAIKIGCPCYLISVAPEETVPCLLSNMEGVHGRST